MTRRLLVVGCVAALLSVSGAQARSPTVLGVVFADNPGELARLDARSLRPVAEPRLPVRAPWGSVARSPDGRMLALSTAVEVRGGYASSLLLVDRTRLRASGRIALGGGFVRVGSWPAARRLLVVVSREEGESLVVDPVARRVLERRPLGGRPVRSTRSAGGLVLLLAPTSGIGAARLAVVDDQGTVRSAALPSVEAGIRVPSDEREAGEELTPGLAVDPAGRRAIVISTRGLVAEVDLETLQVAYHTPTARAPAAVRKLFSASQRTAVWVDDSHLAVSGLDYEPYVDPQGTQQVRAVPAGLTLFDTQGWSTQLVDRRVSGFTLAARTLLSYGTRSDSGTRRSSGIGLVGYAVDGTRRFALLGNEAVGDAQAIGPYVYISSHNARHYRVVDPRAGRVVAAPWTRAPTALVPDG